MAIVFWGSAAVGQDVAPDADGSATAAWTELYRLNLEENLRWILARERANRQDLSGECSDVVPRVGVFADFGVWHLGARSIVEALEREGVTCRVLDRTLLVPPVLGQFDTLIMPGGWAPFQLAALDKSAQGALKQFVADGGRCVGVCAGAYLVSRSARWNEMEYPYPLQLYDGIAAGPVPGLNLWPQADSVRLALTADGRALGLDAIEGRAFLFNGGSCFVGGSEVTTLARYPDGSSAVISFPFGKGDVVLSGVHFERPAPQEGGDEAPVPAIAGPILKALVVRSTGATP
jgi:glutamine amidotransferase-like uncharacterized protein